MFNASENTESLFTSRSISEVAVGNMKGHVVIRNASQHTALGTPGTHSVCLGRVSFWTSYMVPPCIVHGRVFIRVTF